jgi:hypothetical protein
MNKKDILRGEFEEFIHLRSSIVMQTDSDEVDINGELIGITILATRINYFAILIVDTRDFTQHDYLPEYVHICSIDKLLDDSLDVYNSYGYEEQKIDIGIMDGNELKDYGDEFIKFIKILYKDNLESHHLIKFINDKIFSNTKKIMH